MSLTQIGENAKQACHKTRKLTMTEKNDLLKKMAYALVENKENLITENKKDLDAAEKNGMSKSLVDRLMLNEKRILDMADGLLKVAKLDDPVGQVLSMKKMENGLTIGQKRVPLGVIGIIYEARPNVTSDAAGLCFKAGNVVILRGGKEAIHSNTCIVTIFKETLAPYGLEHTIQLIEDTSRETAREMMRMNQYIDVLIPRGGAGLIQSVIENSTVPVIETGVGNCHIFVDESANLENATEIIINAKTQRPSVCNACETFLVHEAIAAKYLPSICRRLQEKEVEIRGDEKSNQIIKNIKLATEEDWATEFGDYIIALKIVKDIDEAIAHITKYSTQHSEAIITENYTNSQRFLDEIDAAAVYVNASTRFTDGMEFGLGAEIGISTQKLHARGPMGLKELTTTKYIIYGTGQIRN